MNKKIEQTDNDKSQVVREAALDIVCEEFLSTKKSSSNQSQSKQSNDSRQAQQQSNEKQETTRKEEG
ncbi:MAG: hypothetical protein K2M51_02455 [Helicobacter sp.]|nr:hypothetical protein [Helicobacter sp.]